MNDIFKTRDFIYINEEKLNSYFSQLYGGLVEKIEAFDGKKDKTSKESDIEGNLGIEATLGQKSLNAFNFISNIIGADLTLGGEAKVNYNKLKEKSKIHNETSEKVLSHFKYAMFEESLDQAEYLIDLDKFIEDNNNIQAGQIRGKLNSRDFIKFTTSSVEVRDYRNASEFISLLKKIYEIAIDIKYSEVKGNETPETDEEKLSLIKKEIVNTENIKSLVNKTPTANNTVEEKDDTIKEQSINQISTLNQLFKLETVGGYKN